MKEIAILPFLTYLIAALQAVIPDVGQDLLAVLQSSQPPHTETILTSLLNEFAATPDHFILVLDDYHALDSKKEQDINPNNMSTTVSKRIAAVSPFIRFTHREFVARVGSPKEDNRESICLPKIWNTRRS